MRIALIADVHGNSIALDAVRMALERVEPDETVFLGDAATNGFDPAGAVRSLRGSGWPAVMGNTDADILDTPSFYYPPDRDALPAAAQRVLEISLWCHEQLDDDDRAYLGTLAGTVEFDLPGGRRLLGFHGSPRSATDVVTATTPEEQMETMFDGAAAALLAGGHTHVQLLRRVGDRTFVNPGSVGLPFARYGTAGTVPLLPVAQYAVVDVTEESLAVRFEEVALDVAAIRDAARASGMPHADWWARLWTDDRGVASPDARGSG